jgi:predicted amidohydrolase
MTRLRLATLAYPVTAPRSFDEFATKFTKLVGEAAAAGAQLLLMPEYASMELAAAYPGAGDVAAELQAVTAQRETLLRLFTDIAMRHKVWLLPGTIPWAEAGGVRNRAPLISPFGKTRFQDKRVMTRFESEQWRISPGAPPSVFSTPWGNIGIAICYDAEFPNLVRAQTKAGAKLILVPSCTDTLHGFNRVQFSARARALENQCFVAMAPTVGVAPALATLDENHGYAAVFGPVDRGFPEDGAIARGMLDVAGWVYADIDLGAIDTVRCDGAVRNFLNWPDDPPPAFASEAE